MTVDRNVTADGPVIVAGRTRAAAGRWSDCPADLLAIERDSCRRRPMDVGSLPADTWLGWGRGLAILADAMPGVVALC